MKTMTPERWQQISRVYQSALAQAPAARPSFVADVCRDDSDLRREVESLLAREHAHVLVDEPIDVAAAAIVDDDSGLQPNECLGPYRIERLIGAGGMGQVYRAIDTRLQRTVALKVLPSALARDPQFRMRFEREAQTSFRIPSPVMGNGSLRVRLLRRTCCCFHSTAAA